ncbi:MAG: ROK family protein [Candidatus Eisenbacteria bacterium]|uniref:ROK family protein n=1 Tax=Eiseniibacteriota bacterium TaxID=2212470 RepID=A0A956RR17_UNCEI|nr:ROK family protein [Candidatus Eisenbacteria bacterium]
MNTIGFDIGGTYVKSGHLSGDGATILDQDRWPTPQTPRALIDEVLTRAGGWDPAAAIGIACAGTIDTGRGVVVRSPNLPGWSDVPLADRFRERTGRSVVVLNDANAFLVAEATLGAARGARHAVGLTIGTGVGGGILCDGELWSGAHGFAGEFGHSVVQMDGPECACGARGCLEALVGTYAIMTRYRAHAASATARDPEELAGRARAGDDLARRLFEETGRFLGLGLRSAAHLLDPELFVIGGGLIGAADLFLPEAVRVLAESALLPATAVPEVRRAALGNAAGWIGAALVARRGSSA